MAHASAGAVRRLRHRDRRDALGAGILEEAFRYANLDYKQYVKIDPRYYRPAEVDLLIGDASKAKKMLGWQPKTTFAQLVKIMVDADDELLAKQLSGQHLRS